MPSSRKIRVPSFIDDPIVGRFISPIPWGVFTDHIIIDNGVLLYEGSILSQKNKKSFKLENIKNVLVLKTKLTPWTKDHKLDIYGRLGTDIEIYLVDIDGEEHELLPRFSMGVAGWGQKELNFFLSELCELSGLQLEEANEPP